MKIVIRDFWKDILKNGDVSCKEALIYSEDMSQSEFNEFVISDAHDGERFVIIDIPDKDVEEFTVKETRSVELVFTKTKKKSVDRKSKTK